MQSRTVRRITSAHAALSLHSHTTRHLTARPLSLRLVGLSASVRRWIQRLSNGTLTQTVPNPPPTQLRPRLLKGSRKCVHHDHVCVRTWRCS